MGDLKDLVAINLRRLRQVRGWTANSDAIRPKIPRRGPISFRPPLRNESARLNRSQSLLTPTATIKATDTIRLAVALRAIALN
jgi:hypothetical protein